MMMVMMLWLFDPWTHDNGIGDGIDFVCVGEVWVWVQREGGSEVTKPRCVFVLFWNPAHVYTYNTYNTYTRVERCRVGQSERYEKRQLTSRAYTLSEKTIILSPRSS